MLIVKVPFSPEINYDSFKNFRIRVLRKIKTVSLKRIYSIESVYQIIATSE
jgi:hypothetical protein